MMVMLVMIVLFALLLPRLPSLAQEFKVDFKAPPGITADSSDKRSVFDTVGFNLQPDCLIRLLKLVVQEGL